MSRRTLTAALLACALGACGLPGAAPEPPAPHLERVPSRSARHLAQLDFDQDAHFAECIEPNCPQRTTKSFATASVGPQSELARLPIATGTPMATEVPIAVSGTPGLAPSSATETRLTLHFSRGSSRLTDEHRSKLRTALPDLRRSERITVSGRTDDLGSEALNQSLALARGLAVRDYLLDLDLQLPARIAIDARGRCCYAAPNDNEASRSRNRRVELAFAPASRPAP